MKCTTHKPPGQRRHLRAVKAEPAAPEVPASVAEMLEHLADVQVRINRAYGVVQRLVGAFDDITCAEAVMADLRHIAGPEHGYDSRRADDTLRALADGLDGLADAAEAVIRNPHGQALWGAALAGFRPSAMGV